jgi:hypothetical protein
MYTYRCPGCGKYHAAEGEFRQGYPTKCLRCGVAIAVTAELVHQSSGAARLRAAAPAAAEDSITKAPAKEAVGVAGKRATAADLSDERVDFEVDAADVVGEEEEVEAVARDKGRKGRPAESDRAKAKKKPAQSLPRRGEDEAEDEAADKAPPEKPAKPTPSGAKKARPKWPLIAAIAAAVLVVGGAGGFFLFGGKKEPEKKVVEKKAAPPKTTQKATPPPPKKETPPPPARPKAPPAPDFTITAPRLSAELASSTIDTNTKYAGKAVQVSGLFEKIEKKDGWIPPPRQFAVFATRGKPISCDVQGSLSDPQRWNGLRPNTPITVLGVYEKDGFLRDCWLLPKFISNGDAKYKGKQVEVEGYIQEIQTPNALQDFPAVRVEGETNDSRAILCMFRKNEWDGIQKLSLNSRVIIQGTCNGVQGQAAEGDVRLDNCQIVHTSAPAADTPRLEAMQLLRTYGEDRNPFFLPPPGEEPRVDKVWTIRDLAHEFAADPKGFDEKYLYHVFTVEGRTQRRMAVEHQIILESGDTDLPYRVECHFSRGIFATIGARSEYRVRGLYTGTHENRWLRLDNCQLETPPPRGPALTGDFLPHTPGRQLTVDVATFSVSVGGKIHNAVRRELHLQGKDGLTEIMVTHAGILPTKSLFDEGDPNRWLTQPRTVKDRAPAASAVYLRRLSGEFVEVGTPDRDDKGKVSVTWKPALKLNARAGGRWEWTAPSAEHKFILEQFGDYNGRTSASIRETITPAADINHPIEILHVYARDLGEVERREWMQLNSRGDKRLLMEKRMLDKASPGTTGAGKSPELRGAEPKKRSDLKEVAPAK